MTSGPITADAATNKVVGVKKSFTVTASAANKVTGLSKAEKKVVKVTKKGKKFTIKGLKAGKATFKIGKKSYIVKVGATAVKASKASISLTKGKAATVTFKTTAGNGDTLTFTASNKKIALNKKSAKVAKNAAAVKVTAKTAGTAKITATSKITGKKVTVKVTVKNATPVTTATPVVTETPVVTGGATTTPDVTATPVATGGATTTPDTTATPEVVTGGTITVTGAALDGATIVVTNASGAAVDTAKRLPAGKYTITVSKKGYITASKEVTIADKDAKVVEFDLEEDLKVASVEALNLAEIKVTFNKKLTGTALTNAAKSVYYTVYKDGSAAATSVSLATVSDDQKSVTLLLTGDTLVHGKTANKVVVSKTIGLDADYTAENVASFDVTIPQVTEVKAVGNQTFQITFSEAIKNKDAAATDIENNGTLTNGTLTNGVFTIANEAGFATGTTFTSTLSADHRTVTVTTDKVLTAGTYKVTVADNTITDYANYPVAADTKTVKIDTAVKVASPVKATVLNRTTVAVEFDGVVKSQTSAKLTWKAGTTSKSVTGAYASKDNSKLYFYFASDDVMPVGKVDFTLEGVKDAYGYDVPTTVFNDQTVVADSIATATTKVVDDGTIEIIFSKRMKGTDDSSNSTSAGEVNNKANYTIVDADGKAVDLTTVNAQYKEVLQTDGTYVYKVVLSKAGWALKGDYTITVSGAKDAIGTEMTKMVETVNVKDTTRPTAAATASYSATSRKISITYSETMATSGDNSITNAKNYMIGNDKLADITGATLASADGKTVIITLPSTYTGTITSGGTKVTIGLVGTTINTVADTTGNILDGGNGKINAEVTINNESAPTINNAATIVGGKNTLLVAVSNLATVDASDFLYTVDGTKWNIPEAATLVTIDGTTYISLTIADMLSASTDRTKVSVKTKTLPSGTTSLNSKSALGSGIDANKTAATIVATLQAWPFQTAIKSAETLNTTQIRVEFDGLVGALTGSTPDGLKEFLAVYNNGTAATISTVEADGDNAVILTVNAALDTEKSIVVKTKPYASNSTVANWAVDKNGVYYSENITGVNAPVTKELKVVSVKTNEVDSITTSTSFEINFNAPIAGADASNLAAKIDSTGKLTVDGYNFGEITGLTTITPADDLKAGIAMSNGNKTMTLTISNIGSQGIDAYLNGKITYTPSAKITSASDTSKKVTVAGKESASTSQTSTVTLGTQTGALTHGTPGSATFTVTTKFVANGTVPTVTVTDKDGHPVTGLTATVTPITANTATVTVSITDAVAAASDYKVTVTANGVTSAVATVTVV